MENKFRTPKIDVQNVISFTCSDDSIEPLLELFRKPRRKYGIQEIDFIVNEWNFK